MPKLSDTQLVILNKAAQRDDRGIIIPDTLPAGARHKIVGSLLAKRLIRDVPKTGDLTVWREKDDRKYALVITDAGLKALGIETSAADAPASKKQTKTKPRKQSGERQPREGTKQAQLIDMLKQPDGATIDEIANAMDWQQHTVRGAIAGTLKKKLGLKIASEKVNRGRVYRIES